MVVYNCAPTENERGEKIVSIRDARLKKNIGLNQFARQIGIKPSYLSQIERGIKKNPSNEIMIKISDGLEKSIQELFFDKSEVT